MTGRQLKRALGGAIAPDERGAQARAWALVRADFGEREPVARTRRRFLPIAALAAALAVVAAAFSPPGRAVLGSLRDAIGRETVATRPALFSLPAPGRMLVSSARGVWVVQPDGSKRLLGRYRRASWSPFGRFIVASRPNELAALDPATGELRWSLARRAVADAVWGGTRTDTRIAYRSGRALRVVAGDGTGDRLLERGVAPVPPAWRPGRGRVLAYATGAGTIQALDVETGRVLWRTAKVPGVRALEWAENGELLLVVAPRKLFVFDRDGRLRFDLLGPGAAPVTDARLAPQGQSVAFVQSAAGHSDAWLIPQLRPDGSSARRIFSGPGRFDEIAWSPNGRWLVLAWRDADQWLFVRGVGARRVRAVSSISAQFRSRSFPRLDGWCCGSSG